MDFTSEQLEAIAKAVAPLLPQIYDDLAHPVLTESGKMLARIPKAINAALSHVDIWIAQREYAVSHIKELLSLELRNTPSEKIVSPEMYVAIPAIEAMSYSMDSENLRSMYAKLLSKAMNEDTKSSVHPAFVDIIRQMSPNDALIMQRFTEDLPIVRFKISADSFTSKLLSDHVMLPSFVDHELSYDERCVSLCALVRQGLIELDYNSKLDCIPDPYEPFYKTTIYNDLSSDYDYPHVIDFQCGVASATLFGRQFISICLQ